MTIQIRDKCIFKNENYDIISSEEDFDFIPEDYGIIPEFRATFCWRGYWCNYYIKKNGIFLNTLTVNCKDQIYPPLNGVNISNFTDRGHKIYKNVNLPIKYTGSLIIGKDAVLKGYANTGYIKASNYNTLLKLVFKDGILIDVINKRNSWINRLRKLILRG